MSENMSAEAIREIERLVKAAQTPTFVGIHGFPAHKVAHIEGGKATIIDADPKPLAVAAATPAEFVRFVSDHQFPESETYYSPKGMVFVRDAATRRDRATCALPLTEPFRWLTEKSSAAMDAKSFVRLLRVTLRECFSDADHAKLSAVRRLKWGTNATAEVEVSRGRESMSRAVVNDVEGIGGLPDEFSLGVRVFENIPQSVVIKCALEIDPSEQTIRLTPLPGELHDAIETALDAVEKLLRTDGMPNAYRGEP